MPDDVITPQEQEDDLMPVAHDDIMKRLLDYQRQLREVIPEGEGVAEGPDAMSDSTAPEAQAALATVTEVDEVDEVVDLTQLEEPEAEVVIIELGEAVAEDTSETEIALVETPSAGLTETAASTSAAEEALAARVAQLEASLDRIGTMIAAVRSDFQDLAIRSDERIAEIEDVLAALGGPSS